MHLLIYFHTLPTLIQNKKRLVDQISVSQCITAPYKPSLVSHRHTKREKLKI